MRRLLAGLMLALPAALPAAEGAAWLKIPQGARSVAMGTAMSAVPGGAEGLWYNPANLGGLKAADVSVSRQAWLGQTRDDYLSLGLPLSGGTMGLFANVLGAEDVYRDAAGNEGGKFSNSAWAAGMGYGVSFGMLRLGLLAKIVNETIEHDQATGFGGDIGLQADLGVPWLHLGLAVKDLGQFTGHGTSLGEVTLPQSYRMGLALDQLIPHVLLSSELRVLPGSRETSFLAGAELNGQAGLLGMALRGGYETAAAQAGGLGGMSVGAGLRLESLKLDFTWTPYGAFGDPYRMSLGWEFGPSAKEAVAKAKPRAKPKAVLPAETAAPEPKAASAPAPAPLSLDKRINKAKGAMLEKRYDEAEAQFLAAIQDYPASARPWTGLFKVYLDQDKKAQAIHAMEQKLALEPDADQALWLKGYRAEP